MKINPIVILIKLIIISVSFVSCSKTSTSSSNKPLIIELIPTHISEFGVIDGSIDLIVTGGVMPYSFQWSNGAITEDIDDLEKGQYNVNVTDNMDDTVSSSSTIIEPDQLLVQYRKENVSYWGGNDGLIDLTVTGGVAPYNYLWSNGANTEDIYDIQAGIYSVSVTDDNDIIISETITISEPLLITYESNKLNEKITVIDENYFGGVNVTVFTGSDGTLIIDSGFEQVYNRLKNTIQALYPGDINSIINTHNHPDHLGGNNILVSGGKMYGHEYGRTDFVNSSANTVFTGITDEFNFSYNGENIQLIPLTKWGHTNTDIAIYFEEMKILCLGDTYLSESFPSVTPSRGAKVQFAVQNYEYILNNFPNDVILIPGHGRTTTMDELKLYLDMVNETVAIVKAQMDVGLSLNDIIANNILIDYDQWGQSLAVQGLDTNYWIRSIYGSY